MKKNFIMQLVFISSLMFFITGCGDLVSDIVENADIQPSGNGGSINTGETGNSGNTGGNGSSNSSDNSDTNTSAPIGIGNSSTEIYGDTAANLYGAGGAIDSTGKYSNPNTGVDPETGRGGFINNVVTPTLDAGNIVAENDTWAIYEDGTAVDKKRNLVLGLAYVDTMIAEDYSETGIYYYEPIADFTKPDNLNFIIEDDILKLKGDINYKQNHIVFQYISEEFNTEKELIVPIEFELLIINPTEQPIKNIITARSRPENIPNEYREGQFDNVDCTLDWEHFFCNEDTDLIDYRDNQPITKRLSPEQFVYKTFNNYKQYFSQEYADALNYRIPNNKAIEGFFPAEGYWDQYGKNIFRQYHAIGIDFKDYLKKYPNYIIPEQTIYTGKFMYQAVDGSIDNIPVEIILTYK